MDSFQIRQKFLEFFKKHGHTAVPSSSLIPADDPSLLFANAGMNQFKDVFLGHEKRGYVRATSSQKCVRAGGKHNDLDEVGFTNRHLTFFEMLGNFSFGDYFKKEAIPFAWEFLTKDMGLDPDSLCVSVYTTDDEAYEIWNKDIGIPPERIYRLGEKENFWQMGDTGPCGPCTEIHMDCGPDVGCKGKDCDPACDCPRFVEIWNLVFMQYNKQADGTLVPLEQTGVDTGMGLERLCMIMQGKDSVFATDLFSFITKKIEALTGVSYAESKPDLQAAFHVIGDHVRSSALLIADGCVPSNEGRGYVLRKIIRRAALFAGKVSEDITLLPTLAKTFIDTMSVVFENLKASEALIIKLVASEVERFATSLEQGQLIFDKYVELNKKTGTKEIPGDQVFKLYDTYGFPPELTRVMAYDQGFTVDMKGFEKEMAAQRAQSGKKAAVAVEIPDIPSDLKTEFVGYDSLESKSNVSFVMPCGDTVWLVTDQSPFYVESGGQVGDKGWVTVNEVSYPVKSLHKVGQAIVLGLIDEEGKAGKGAISVGDEAHCVVDFYKRKSSEKNHIATHLLQAALIQVLGGQVKQAGSLVCEDYLRFDYNYSEAMTKEQIEQVEQIVNLKIQEDIALKVFYTSLKEAQSAGVTAFFGEKYDPEKVRVVQVPGFSAELCGGTHPERTGEIGCFKIVSESALSTGVRRIIAMTGPRAVELFQGLFNTVKTLGERYKVKPEQVLGAVEKHHEQLQGALRTIKQMRKKLIGSQVAEWQELVEQVGDIPFLFLSLEDYGNDELKTICTELEKRTPGVYFLLSKTSDKFCFVGYVSKSFADSVNLSKMGKPLGEACGLRGGGKPTLIQGGGVGVDPATVEAFVKEWLRG